MVKLKAIIFCCGVIASTLFSECRADSAAGKHPDPVGDAHHRSRVVTRAYLMNGLAGNAMEQIGEKLRARGAIVEVGSWTQADAFESEACAHRGDRIIVIGHSLGATAAARVATQARACGARNVTMVGIDPPATGASVPRGSRAVNFVGALNGSIEGARNVPVPGYDHNAVVTDSAMQNRVVSTALSH